MLSIGIIGASRIARDAVLRPATQIEGVQVQSIAARQFERAQSYATQNSIPHAAESYDSLLDRKDIDLVYIGLPPYQHEQWTMRALRAGKHVLCEKPLSLDSASAERMVYTARELGLHLIEAVHCRFHPMFNRILELCHSEHFGAVKHIDAHFNVPVVNAPGEFRYNKDLGGGALMDLGCYPIHWIRTVIGSEPAIVSASSRFHSSGVDLSTEARLQFLSGETASVQCSMDPALPSGVDAKMKISSNRGWIEVDNPLQPGFGSEIRWSFADHAGCEEYDGDTFPFQLEHVIGVLEGIAAPVTGGADSIGNMKAIEGVKAYIANKEAAQISAE